MTSARIFKEYVHKNKCVKCNGKKTAGLSYCDYCDGTGVYKNSHFIIGGKAASGKLIAIDTDVAGK